MSLKTDWKEKKEILKTYEADLDLPPERCHYHDEGCEYAVSCLNCPFIRCLFDEPGGRQRYLKKVRDREMVRLHLEEGKVVREIASIFGVSERTVQRVLKQGIKQN